MQKSTPSALLRFMLLAILPISMCSGQGVKPEASTRASADTRFEELAARYKRLLSEFEAEEGEDEMKWFLEKHPRNIMASDFLKLEEETRGTKVGFSCMHHLVAIGEYIPDSEITKGKLAALKILGRHYQDHPNVDTVFQFLFDGPSASFSKAFYRKLIESSKREHVRANAMYKLANMLASESNMFQSAIDHAEPVPELSEPKREAAAKQREAFHANMKKTMEENRNEARSLIDRIQADHAEELVPPATKAGIPRIVAVERNDFDELLKRKRQRIVDLLPAAQFELEHSIGQPSPSIDGNDAAGKPMKLADFHGKVVVLMFSFKGCGPCEAMYPRNRKLIDDLSGEKFVFVGVQGDKKLETVQESLEAGVITWRVWWDGKEKEISNQWNIKGWPTYFVLDKRGVIRFRGIHGKELEAAVRSLLKKDAE